MHQTRVTPSSGGRVGTHPPGPLPCKGRGGTPAARRREGLPFPLGEGPGERSRRLTDVQPGQKLGWRGRWRVFRERWPFLPRSWRWAIIGFTIICVAETIRTVLLIGRWLF